MSHAAAATVLQSICKDTDHCQSVQVTAQQQKQDLHITVAETEQQIAGLRKWLCEPVDSDPAAMLATIWNFANSFDQAYRNVQRLLQ